MRRHMVSLFAAATLLTPVFVGASLAVAPMAAATTCSATASTYQTGSTQIESLGYEYCNPGVNDMEMYIHNEICTFELGGTCITWQDNQSWPEDVTPSYAPPGIVAASFYHYSSVLHQHRYRTQVVAYYNGGYYGGSATSADLVIP